MASSEVVRSLSSVANQVKRRDIMVLVSVGCFLRIIKSNLGTRIFSYMVSSCLHLGFHMQGLGIASNSIYYISCILRLLRTYHNTSGFGIVLYLLICYLPSQNRTECWNQRSPNTWAVPNKQIHFELLLLWQRWYVSPRRKQCLKPHDGPGSSSPWGL